jgi:hypothetical protein
MRVERAHRAESSAEPTSSSSSQLVAITTLHIVPRVSCTRDAPDARCVVAAIAAAWFARHLASGTRFAD